MIRIALLFTLLPFWSSFSQDIDFSKQKTLFIVGTAHFDTRLPGTIKSTVNDYLPTTMNGYFRLFEKYPDYRFSFEGAFKYMLMKEYYPSGFEKVGDYIKSGQWNICGSSIDAFDVHIPSPFAISRSILLGQNFYKNEFSTQSRDVFLPECFGLSYALPTVANFCGLKGFSTQKLSQGASVGLPFDFGAWQGVDGSKIAAALNASDYKCDIKTELSNDPLVITSIEKSARSNGGVAIGYRYFCAGDQGGTPGDTAMFWLQKSLQGNGPVKVKNEPADFVFKEIKDSELNKLQVYNGELLMSPYGTGCYTSQAAMKRWNRKNELLAESAEKASVIASWAGAAYPQQKLNDAWQRFLWHQSHNDLSGTGIPEVYRYSWNDELLSMNQFASVLEHAAAGTINLLNTKTKHVPLVVYNPLSIAREDIVEAEVVFPKKVEGVRVNDKEGKEIPCQILKTEGNKAKILFIANVPATGYEFYEIQQTGKPQSYQSDVKASSQSIENGQYVMFFDPKTYDIKRILEKTKMRDLLARPMRLSFFNDTSEAWPAWEIHHKTIATYPKYIDKIKSIEVIENGPVRASVKIVRERDGSVITQYIRVLAGKAGERAEFYNEVDWNSKGTLMKADFSFAVPTSKATYDLGIGTIQRGNNTEKLYEVPAQNWADMSLPDGSFGISIFSDCKYGWDKPDNNTLRLTLIRTPKTGKEFKFQSTNDIGRHVFSYAIYAHQNDWRKGKTQWAAQAFNQPLVAFQTSSHEGPLGRSFSFASLNTQDVMIKTIKKAENSDDIVIHVQELIGAKAGNIKLNLPSTVLSAKEINGAEEIIADARVENSQLIFNINPYQPKAFALKIAGSDKKVPLSESVPLNFDYNLDGVSDDNNRSDGAIDNNGTTIPAEQFPDELKAEGIQFRFGPAETGKMNLLSCKGQFIKLPQGDFNSIHILAFALKDSKAEFKTDTGSDTISVPYFSGFIGQWDGHNRTKDNFAEPFEKAYLKKVPVAWNSTHLHDRNGNKTYEFAYFFKLKIEIIKGTTTLVLPNDPNIIIAAISIANDKNINTRTAQPLTDKFFK